MAEYIKPDLEIIELYLESALLNSPLPGVNNNDLEEDEYYD